MIDWNELYFYGNTVGFVPPYLGHTNDSFSKTLFVPLIREHPITL
jgi:hypothetical protein